MKEVQGLLEEYSNEKLYQIILSNPVQKEGAFKLKVRPVLKNESILYQVSAFEGTKVFHHNYEQSELVEYLTVQMESHFKQLEIENQSIKVIVLISKKGKVTIKKKNVEEKQIELSHNRTKKYILPEDVPVSFLVDLGIQTKEGKIVRSKYDKFKQINRYLEFVEDILPALETREGEIRIIDFGCGKSYLTFALYYFLRIMKGMNVRIIGLDLKEDVIQTCNQLRDKYAYEFLTFLKGDIAAYKGSEKVDMVVTLHACDTATDYAIYQAIKWDAKVIFSVPCCQHELNNQIQNKQLEPILKYGLLKERIAALITDGLRSNILEKYGYDTQILEFIQMEHTPKNILIRAVKRANGEICKKSNDSANLDELIEFLHAAPTLTKLLENE